MTIITDYLATADPASKAALEHICAQVKQLAPEAEAALSYGMPAFKYHSKPLLGFVIHAHHLSLHPFSPAVIRAVTSKLPGFDLAKGTIRFSAERPIPEAVINQIITLRLQEIMSQA